MMERILYLLLLMPSFLLCMGCMDEEREALLLFKKSFVDEQNLLGDWEDGNCCRWTGVGCSNATGHVVEINFHALNGDCGLDGDYCLIRSNQLDHSLSSLKYLEHLDLSCSCFNRTTIPGFIGSLTTLKHLDLSETDFTGNIPPQLGDLTNLQYIDLSGTNFTGNIPPQLGSLTNLQYLDLSGTDFTGNIPPQLGNLTNLQYLDLSGTNFTGNIPPQLGNLTNLQYLDLHYAYSLYSDDLHWLSHLSSLWYLDLSDVGLAHAVNWAIVFDTLPSLSMLNLSSCGLQGLPNTASAFVLTNNTSSIKILNLSGNNFSDSTILDRLLRKIKGSLIHLDISYCEIQGPIPHSITNISSLKTLDLGGNRLNGSILDSLGSLAQLEFLDLSDNSFQGSIPKSLSSMFNLRTLELINNNLSGLVSDAHFVNMTKLEDLLLSYNHLALNLSSDLPFQLKTIDLASCQLGPQFPLWLRMQRSVHYLDISDAKISDVIPNWFWTTSSRAIHLNLSNNNLIGEVPRSLHFLSAINIDLSSNQLQGQLPYLNSSVEVIILHQNSFSGDLQPILNEAMGDLKAVILSRNHLSGEIPSAICSLQWLEVLHVPKNNLSGRVPKCQISTPLSQITCLILASNNLHGSIPQWMAAQSLKYLDLHNNSIQGEIPSFFKNCTALVIFDLAENKLTGKLPSWIGERLSSLRFLRLRSNMLSGTIPHQMSYLSSLQVLDLAQNNLSGSIPPSLKNFTSMANATKAMEKAIIFGRSGVIPTSADVSFPVVVKGREEDYTTTLSLVMVFDLSCNAFSGEIPMEMMDLVGLQSLNLSGNQLTGNIPNNIGRMAYLETLDLSSNHLIGAIPASITLLSSLSSLNLSYNNLSGAIPSGKQLQTLTDTSIYAGNPNLCGFPLPAKCPGEEPPRQLPQAGVETRINDSDMFELYLSMGVGYMVGLWGTCALFLIKKSWRIAYFCFFDDVADKFFAAKERLRRWMCPRLLG